MKFLFVIGTSIIMATSGYASEQPPISLRSRLKQGANQCALFVKDFLDIKSAAYIRFRSHPEFVFATASDQQKLRILEWAEEQMLAEMYPEFRFSKLLSYMPIFHIYSDHHLSFVLEQLPRFLLSLAHFSLTNEHIARKIETLFAKVFHLAGLPTTYSNDHMQSAPWHLHPSAIRALPKLFEFSATRSATAWVRLQNSSQRNYKSYTQQLLAMAQGAFASNQVMEDAVDVRLAVIEVLPQLLTSPLLDSVDKDWLREQTVTLFADILTNPKEPEIIREKAEESLKQMANQPPSEQVI